MDELTARLDQVTDGQVRIWESIYQLKKFTGDISGKNSNSQIHTNSDFYWPQSQEIMHLVPPRSWLNCLTYDLYFVLSLLDLRISIRCTIWQSDIQIGGWVVPIALNLPDMHIARLNSTKNHVLFWPCFEVKGQGLVSRSGQRVKRVAGDQMATNGSYSQVWIKGWSVCLKGLLSKNLQKPYKCGRGGYNSWDDGTYHVDTLGPTKTQGYRIMFWILQNFNPWCKPLVRGNRWPWWVSLV